MQVQEIKRDAEQSIKLYCSQITDAIKKQKFLHGDKNVEAKMKEVEKLYRNYQLALYVYVFSYFVEIILFENFEKAYLDNVLKTIITIFFFFLWFSSFKNSFFSQKENIHFVFS